ncbi:MAG: DNA-3-methyladenine glycosylase family protein [Anaeromyxobacteraceae bacterium]
MQRLRVAVREPFRLDLTVAVLQRLPVNPVEVWVPGAAPAPAPTPAPGRYLRAFSTLRGPVAWIVTPDPAGGLLLELRGPAGDPAPWIARLRRALGTDVDLAPFYARARRFPPLARLARMLRGVKPPRFAALHESFASVLLFQQVSLASALATLRRLVVSLSPPVEVDGTVLHPFPDAGAIDALSERELRGFGMSGVKARALRAACRAIDAGALTEDALAALPSPALRDRLLALDGVGPWTAELLMLRGFGRLDAFPPGDVAAERLLRDLGSDASGRELIEALGPTRGMLYYHLSLHRLAALGRGPFAGAAVGLTVTGARARGRPPSPPRT